MTEFLDVYDANRNHIGTADRNVVHACGLWHKTVHCWLVIRGDDGLPMMIFQRRSKSRAENGGKLYTTASGHVSAGETLESAFASEIAQEIGIDASTLKPHHLYETIWIGDIKRRDGLMFIDRVFANVYYALYQGDMSDLKFADGEVDSVVAIGLDDVIDFVRGRMDAVQGIEFDGQATQAVTLGASDFVLGENETVYDKFGRIAEQIKNDIQ
jgi:8-oxo-dGTP pyrophosphatase MutT (NUDIX family)